jgi:hypothetical protein
MKKIILLLAATIVTLILFAQAPQKLSYQAVIRNASNVLISNTTVGMRISILQGSATGAAVYVETQTPTTNTNGLAIIEIGTGTVITGTFAAINWSTGLYWIKTETDPAGGTAYNIIGINQLLSVPYALFAASDGNHIKEPGNIAIGNDALRNNTTGSANTAIGISALSSNRTGIFNTAVGTVALGNNISGNNNTATGTRALYFYGVASNNNTANGVDALLTGWGSNNSAFGYGSLAGYDDGDINGYGGENNTATGAYSMRRHPAGNNNTANGFKSLYNTSTGYSNVAVGVSALYNNTTANNLVAVGDSSLFNNNGVENTAVGSKALYSNTSGSANTANGYQALQNNTSGILNTANGYQALYKNTTGLENTAIGTWALSANTTGRGNTAIGLNALTSNITGNNNIAIGYYTLQGAAAVGSYNIALGTDIGLDLNVGSNNIFIGHYGGTTESNSIHIGSTGAGPYYGPGPHTKTYIAGINGTTSATGIPVYINAEGQLGTLTSSARFKENIVDMGNISDDLLKLHPVTFEYKDEVANGDKTIQYGLIAEEVAKVNSDLVIYDKEGKPYTIRYQMLTPMLINALQKEHKLTLEQNDKIQAQQKQIDELNTKLQLLEIRLNALANQLKK